MTLSVGRQIAISAAAGLIGALVGVGVASRTSDTSSPTFLAAQPVESPSNDTVEVTKGEIRSQFTVTGTIADNPSFLVLAGSDGELSQDIASGLIDADTRLGQVSGEALIVERQVELVEWMVPDGSAVTGPRTSRRRSSTRRVRRGCRRGWRRCVSTLGRS